MHPRNSKGRRSRKDIEHKSDVPYTSVSRYYPIAPRLRTKLRYNEQVGVTTSAGPGYVNYDWNLNGLFDPNSTGTGHQPRGFDQLASLYNRYRVYRTKWEIIATVTNSADGALLGVMPSNVPTPGTFNDLSEQTYAVVKPFSQATPVVIRGQIGLAQLNGKSPEAYMADDTTGAQITANPSEQLILHTGVLNTAGAAVLYTLFVSLEFDVEFSDPTQLNQS
jgi:hypothetical protein